MKGGGGNIFPVSRCCSPTALFSSPASVVSTARPRRPRSEKRNRERAASPISLLTIKDAEAPGPPPSKKIHNLGSHVYFITPTQW